MRAQLAAEPPLAGAYKPRRGDFCVAQFSEDDLWYRARIEKVNQDKVNVHYIDFGNVSDVKITIQIYVLVSRTCGTRMGYGPKHSFRYDQLPLQEIQKECQLGFQRSNCVFSRSI